MNRLLLCFIVITTIAGLVERKATAQIVRNGDFSANASSFVYNPGWEGQTGGGFGSGNPAIADWIAAGNTANGGTDSGVNGSPGYASFNQFGPDSTKPNSGIPPLQPRIYGFIQQNGPEKGTLTQDINLIPFTTYKLTFEAAQRSGDSGLAFGSVTVKAGGAALVVDTLSGLNSTAFTTYTDTFTTGSDASLASIVLMNTSGIGTGRTVAFTNISIIAIPEPSTIAFLSLTFIVFLFLKRRSVT